MMATRRKSCRITVFQTYRTAKGARRVTRKDPADHKTAKAQMIASTAGVVGTADTVRHLKPLLLHRWCGVASRRGYLACPDAAGFVAPTCGPGPTIRSAPSFMSLLISGDTRIAFFAATRRRSTASSSRTNDVGSML